MDKDAQAAFREACRGGDVATAQKVWTPNNNENAIFTEGLQIACDAGEYKIVKWLVESVAVALKNPPKKFDLDAEDWDGDTVLRKACEFGDADFVKTLLTRGARHEAFGNATSLLVHSIENGRFEVVKVLVESGSIDIDQFKNGKTDTWALHVACASEKYNIAKYLIEKGAKVIIDDVSPITLLCFSDKGKSRDVVISLLRSDPDCVNVEEEKPDGTITPLGEAVASGWDELVWILILSGADKTKLGDFPYKDDDEDEDEDEEETQRSPAIQAAFRDKWTLEDFKYFPQAIKEAILTLLLVSKTNKWSLDKPVLQRILTYTAFGWYTFGSTPRRRQKRTRNAEETTTKRRRREGGEDHEEENESEGEEENGSGGEEIEENDPTNKVLKAKVEQLFREDSMQTFRQFIDKLQTHFGKDLSDRKHYIKLVLGNLV